MVIRSLGQVGERDADRSSRPEHRATPRQRGRQVVSDPEISDYQNDVDTAIESDRLVGLAAEAAVFDRMSLSIGIRGPDLHQDRFSMNVYDFSGKKCLVLTRFDRDAPDSAVLTAHDVRRNELSGVAALDGALHTSASR